MKRFERWRMRLTIAVFGAVAMSFVWGCSSSSGSSVGSGSTSGGGQEVLCTVSKGAVDICYIVKELTSSAAVSDAMSGCAQQTGTLVSSCPSSGNLGCCTVPAMGPGTVPIETCYYAGTTSEWQGACASSVMHGTWSANP